MKSASSNIKDKKNPTFLNYFSGIENKDEIYSCAQLEALTNTQHIVVKEELKEICETNNNNKVIADQNIVDHIYDDDDDNDEEEDDIGVAAASVTTLINKPDVVKVNQTPTSITASLFGDFVPIVKKTIPSQFIVIQSNNEASSNKADEEQQEIEQEEEEEEEEIEKDDSGSIVSKLFTSIVTSLSPGPQPVTSKLFVPRTEDMNKGFLMFSEEEPGLTSKLKFLSVLLFTSYVIRFVGRRYLDVFVRSVIE